MTKEQKSRKADLQHRLFDPHKPDDHPRNQRRVSPEEVKQFLQLAALSHQAYYQYTNLDALKGMLKSGCLYLTRVADLNDLLECKVGDIADRTYVASFAFGHVENIAMWWMYGFKGDVMRPAVRIRFDGNVMHSWVSRIQNQMSWTTIQRVVPRMKNGPKLDTFAPLPVPVESVSFHDVMYQYGKRAENTLRKPRIGSVSWNGLVANETRCEAFSDATSCPALASCIKEYSWSYEHETRLVVTLESPCPGVHRIAIPFSDALESLNVTLGDQEASYKLKPETVVRELKSCPKAFKKTVDWDNAVHSGKYPVAFKGVAAERGAHLRQQLGDGKTRCDHCHEKCNRKEFL